ncbi:MAG: lipopolysaccharide heptosyltransferase II [Gemmataceae bacterium]
MNIALFLPNWIGDAVMATPAVRAIRVHHRSARIVGVLKPYITGVVEGSGWFDKLVYLDSTGPWSQRWPAVAWKLRRSDIDLAVLFPNTFRSALVAALAGCRRRIGYVRYARGPLLTDRLWPMRDEQGRLKPSPVIDAYDLLAETAGCPRPGHRMELFTTPQDEEVADRVWQREGLLGEQVVCLNPGAAFGASKYWPSEYFVALARNFVDRLGVKVLVLCGPKERELAQTIADDSHRPGVRTLANYRLSLGLTKACVRRASLLVSTDSGPRHFAAAFEVPVVSLFGPTHIAWTETYFDQAVHLQKKVACGPCQLRSCPLDHRCMKLLIPEEVFQAASRLLETTRRSAG